MNCFQTDRTDESKWTCPVLSEASVELILDAPMSSYTPGSMANVRTIGIRRTLALRESITDG